MSDVKVNENDLDGAIDMLGSISSSLKELSGKIEAIDLSDLELEIDLENTVSSIYNIIDSGYNDSSIGILRRNIDETRSKLRNMDGIEELFKELENLEDFGNFTDYVAKMNREDNSIILEGYLKNNFVEYVEVLGGYRVKNNLGQIFYLSDDCLYNDDVKFVAYYPSDKDNNKSKVCNIIDKGSIPSGTIIALSNGPTDGNYMSGCSYRRAYDTSVFARYDDMSSDLGIKTTSVQTIGFSTGGLLAMPFLRMDEYLSKHDEIRDTSILVVDGGEFANGNRLFGNEIPCKTLIEKKVPVYLISSGGEQYNGVKYSSFNLTAAQRLSSNGLDTYILSHNDYIDHGAMDEKLFSTGLYRFLSGETQQFSNVNPADYTVSLYKNGNSSRVDNFFDNFLAKKEIVKNEQTVTVSTGGKIFDNNYVDVKLDEYFSNEFGNCLKLDNGGYKVDGGNGVVYYFPDDYANSKVNLIAYYPGDGGVKDSRSLANMLETNGVASGEVYALRTSWGVGEYYNNMGKGLYDYFDKTAESLNVKVKGFQTISFSRSGIAAITEMNSYLQKHSDNDIKNCSVILADSSTVNVSEGTLISEGCDMLVEKNIPVYLVCSKDSSYKQSDACEVYSSVGLNTYLLYENTVGDYSKKPEGVENWDVHTGINEVIFRDNLYRYFLNKSVDVKNASNYEVYKYDTGSNGVFSTQIEDFFIGGIGNEVLFDEDGVVEDIVIDGKKVTVSTKYETLDDGTKYQVNIIGEVNENTPVILINHGGGHTDDEYANGGDYRYLENWLNSGELGKNNAVIVRYDRTRNVGANCGSKILEEVVSTYNLSYSNCVTAGFSSGGEPAIKQMADLLRIDPTMQAPTVMLLDGNLQNKPSNVISEDDLKLLGEHDAVIYVVEREGYKPDMVDHQRWATQYGINIIRVENGHTKYGGMDNDHLCLFKDYFELGLQTFLTGNGDFPNKTYTDPRGVEQKCFLPATRYNAQTGLWEGFDLSGKNIYDVYEMLGIDYSKFPQTKKVTIPVQESITPVQEPITPVQEPITPVQEPITPVQEPTTPVQEPTTPVQEPTTSVQEPTIPVQEPTTSVQEPTIPVQEPTIPVQEPTTSVQKPTIPVQELITSVQEPTTPFEDDIINIDNNIYNDINDNSNGKKYILPGLLGTAFAALIAKIGSIIKKKKKDNEDDDEI